MRSLKISIVTITLNRRDFLNRAIQSVIDQRYPEFEHIVVDGASTDGTVELLRTYPHLKWISERDAGQAEAMNKGIQLITGDIFGWLNSDDSYPSGVFQRVNEYFSHWPDVAMIYGTCNIVDQNGRHLGSTTYRSFQRSRLMLGFNVINTPAVFVRTSVLKTVGSMNLALKATYDVDMWMRIARRFPIRAVPTPLSNLCLHKSSGLVSTQLHVPEMAALRQRCWEETRGLAKYFLVPYFLLWEWMFYRLKFAAYLRKTRA
jgi:glycosyltransferase involved in cell wall biosynthesis